MPNTRTLLLLTLIILSTLVQASTINTYAQSFTLVSYHYTSSSGDPTIYPGSKNVELVVTTKYTGSQNAYSVTGCIVLPQGFNIVRGYSECSPARDANDTVYEVVEQGDIVIFKFYFNVLENTSPGTYYFTLNITYRIQTTNTTITASETITEIKVKVSPYPEVILEPVDYYWSPDAYPGSQGVTLNIVLENKGNITITSGNLKITLPENLVEKPRTTRVNIGVVNPKDRATITVNNVDILVNATPNKKYPIEIEGNITARTNDGVTYTTTIKTTVNVEVDKAPKIILETLDYGLTTTLESNNTRSTRIYLLMQSKDTKTINSITAIFQIISNNTFFENKTSKSIAVLRGPYNYGDYITINSNPIILNNTENITFKLTLIIFGSSNGAEFWSTQEYYYTIKLQPRKLDVDVVDVYWDNHRGYPGSTNKNLHVVIANNDVVSLTRARATLLLPQGFSPSKLTVEDVTINPGSYTDITFTGIDIDPSIKPGNYPAKLVIEGYVHEENNAYHKVRLEYTITIPVEEYMKPILEVVDYGWVNGRAYTTSTNIKAYIEFMVSEPVTIEQVVATIRLPSQLVFIDDEREKNVTLTGTYSYGQTFRIETPSISVVTNEPGYYPIVYTLKMLVRIHGSNTWIRLQYTVPLRILKPKLNVTIIDASWTSGGGRETYSGTIHLAIQSYSIDQLETIVVIVKPLTSNVKFWANKQVYVSTVRGPIGYGNVFSVNVNGVDVKTNRDSIPIAVIVHAIARIGEEYYKSSTVIEKNITLQPRSNQLVISSINTLYQGSYSPLLPSSDGVIVRITLLNKRPEPITSIKPEISLPKGFHIKGIDGSCLNGVAAGSTCTLNIHLRLDNNLKPGPYNMNLTLKYVVRHGSSTILYTQSMNTTLLVNDIESYLPKPKPIEWFWGTQTPTTVFIGNRNAVLTILVYNPGRYSADGIIASLKPINKTVGLVKDKAYCGTLAPGTSCRITFNLDLANITVPGKLLFNVYISYMFRSYGVHYIDNTSYTIMLRVEEYAGGQGLEVIGYGWSNDWPVYPNTENATYNIVIANRWPYPVSGIRAKLILPQGFKTVTGSTEAYIAGPIQPLNIVTLSFKVTIGNVSTGIHVGKLLLDYVLEVGGARLRKYEEHNISFIVNNLYNSITILDPSWATGAPEPGTHGAILVVRVRNNLIPSMNGPVLRIKLPEGIYCSINNESTATLSPVTSTNIEELVKIIQASPSELANLLKNMPLQPTISGQGGGQSLSEGSIVEFAVPLNILVDRKGVYFANATLDFIDHWGNIRRIEFKIPIRILGTAKVVKVWSPRTLRIVNGTGNLTITLTNNGTSPVYNVYVYLIPKSPITLPVDNVKYIDVLHPGKPVSIVFRVRYNPTAIMYGAGGTALQYSSLPVVLTIMYRDVVGRQYVYNTSTTVLIEPFIDIRFSEDVKAELRGTTLVVSGTIVNYGLATARSVEVRAIVGEKTSKTFIGDIDPASQSAFRVELTVPSSTTSVRVEAVYRDEYNMIHMVSKTLPVTVLELNTTTTVVERSWITPTHITVIVLVAVFLGVIAMLLYRYLKKHTRRLEEVQLP